MQDEALALVSALAAALDEEKVRYCHWKSNAGLNDAIRGNTDLDLLIDPAHRFLFVRTIVRLGFKQAWSHRDRRFPGIWHYYGYDETADKFVDIHAHFRLVVGFDLIKNYELPFIGTYLDTRHTSTALPTPSVEMEYVVFVIRMVLKRRLLAWLFGSHPRLLWQVVARRAESRRVVRRAPSCATSGSVWTVRCCRGSSRNICLTSIRNSSRAASCRSMPDSAGHG